MGERLGLLQREAATAAPCAEMLFQVDPGSSVSSLGFNLVGDESCVTASFPASPGGRVANLNGDFVGTLAAPLDPRLNPLALTGGPTATHLPLQETPHPVIDQGSCGEAEIDQRGKGKVATGHRAHNVGAVPNNPDGDGCDIGAVEYNAHETDSRGVLDDGLDARPPTLFWSAEVS